MFWHRGGTPFSYATPPTNERIYIKWIEWNPLQKDATAGNPSRTHLRELFTSRLEFLETDVGDETSVHVGYIGLYYTPLEDEMRAILGDQEGITVLQTDEVFVAKWPNTVEPDFVTVPAPVITPRTNDDIDFLAIVLGTLAEPVAARTLDWTLTRISTLEEVLSPTGSPPQVTLDNFPVDTGTLTVRYNGADLTDGVDYSVVLATGVITFLGAHDPLLAGVYDATYEHAGSPASPAWGSLVITSSITDGDGVGQATVRYDDDSDLVGQKDRIDVEVRGT
jgi:hypothetical protein